jgi:hypothetical protein
MKKVTLFLVCLFISILALARSSWQQMPNAPASVGRFDDIFFLNEDLGWGATGGGYVLKPQTVVTPGSRNLPWEIPILET